MEAFGKAEKRKKPSPVELFEDVYDEIPIHLQKQMDSLKEHLSKNGDKYPVQSHEVWSWGIAGGCTFTSRISSSTLHPLDIYINVNSVLYMYKYKTTPGGVDPRKMDTTFGVLRVGLKSSESLNSLVIHKWNICSLLLTFLILVDCTSVYHYLNVQTNCQRISIYLLKWCISCKSSLFLNIVLSNTQMTHTQVYNSHTAVSLDLIWIHIALFLVNVHVLPCSEESYVLRCVSRDLAKQDTRTYQ